MTAAILALLLAAPDRVLMIAKPQEAPGFFSRLRKSLAGAAHRLYLRDDDDVARGNGLLAQGDAQGALREYDKARTRLPDDPGVAFDRATALLKVDAATAGAAAGEAQRALQGGDAGLKPKAAYQLALALEGTGDADAAIRQYGAALALDPDDVDPKVNLELLLRTEERRRRNPAGQPRQDQPSPEGAQQKPAPRKDEADRKQQASPTPQPSSGKERQQQQQEQQDPAGQQQSGEQPQEDKQRQAGQPKGGSEKPMDRTEAQRLLDALRASEKNLQPWRFAKQKSAVKRRDLDKDW
jgi:tetratricopeptide (TPR) repeat protein